MEVLYEPTFIELGRDVFGLFPDGPQHTVIGAWTLNARQMYIGFTRLLYTFFAVCYFSIRVILAESSVKSGNF